MKQALVIIICLLIITCLVLTFGVGADAVHKVHLGMHFLFSYGKSKTPRNEDDVRAYLM